MTNTSRIKLYHLLTKPDEEREINSINDIKNLCSISDLINYNQIINEPFIDNPPSDSVMFGRADWVIGKTKPYFTFGLISGHYGCYLAHKNAILNFLEKDTEDFLIIVECDCKINVDYQIMLNKIQKACDLLHNSDFKIFTLVNPNHQTTFFDELDNNIATTNLVICAHMYILHKKHKIFYKNLINKYGWHTWDWWLNLAFQNENEKFLCYKNDNLTSQYAGNSQIDRI